MTNLKLYFIAMDILKCEFHQPFGEIAKQKSFFLFQTLTKDPAEPQSGENVRMELHFAVYRVYAWRTTRLPGHNKQWTGFANITQSGEFVSFVYLR